MTKEFISSVPFLLSTPPTPKDTNEKWKCQKVDRKLEEEKEQSLENT